MFCSLLLLLDYALTSMLLCLRNNVQINIIIGTFVTIMLLNGIVVEIYYANLYI